MLRNMWERRRRAVPAPECSTALDVDLLAVARTVVQEVRAEPDDPLDGDLDEVEVEVVHVIEGQHMGQPGEPGPRMTWHQGQNAFGFLIPLGRLIQEAGGVETIAVCLRLAIDEPHGPTPDQSRLWFTDLPSGPY